MKTDLTSQEQGHVRAALRFSPRAVPRGWAALAKALRAGESTLANVMGGQYAVTASLAFRVARFASVRGRRRVLEGRFPRPGTCPHSRAPRGGGLVSRSARGAWTPEALARSLELATMLGLCAPANDNGVEPDRRGRERGPRWTG